MNIRPTELNGLYEIENKKFHDERGEFVKTFHKGVFETAGLEHNFKESFYSTSKKNVIRGMHYQLPPNDHAKLVYVTKGEILDVAVDIRKESETFGRYFTTVLSEENAKSLYIGKGFAHGFLTISDNATVIYLTSTEHNPDSDTGIRWDSFNFNWNSIIDPIISNRDKLLEPLKIRSETKLF